MYFQTQEKWTYFDQKCSLTTILIKYVFDENVEHHTLRGKCTTYFWLNVSQCTLHLFILFNVPTYIPTYIAYKRWCKLYKWNIRQYLNQDADIIYESTCTFFLLLLLLRLPDPPTLLPSVIHSHKTNLAWFNLPLAHSYQNYKVASPRSRTTHCNLRIHSFYLYTFSMGWNRS